MRYFDRGFIVQLFLMVYTCTIIIAKNSSNVNFRNEKTYFYNILSVILRVIFVSIHIFFIQSKSIVIHG